MSSANASDVTPISRTATATATRFIASSLDRARPRWTAHLRSAVHRGRARSKEEAMKRVAVAVAVLLIGVTSLAFADDMAGSPSHKNIGVGFHNVEAPVSYTHLTLPTSDLV